MKKVISIFSVLALLGLSAQITGASSSWTSDNQTLISSSLPALYEPSGAFWHSGLNKLLIVSDENGLATMDEDGANVSSWTVGGDNEAITVVDPNGTLAYIGIEKPSRQIVEVNLSTGAATGKSWDLTTWLSGSDNAGMEALTYVPAGQHSFNTANGVFLANKETSSTIYAFDVNLNSSGTLTNVGTISTPAGYSTMRDMFFDRSSGVLYMIFGSTVVEMKLDGTVLDRYSVSGSSQEGITKSDNYTFIAHDNGLVYRYGTKTTPVVPDVPVVTDPDADGDGYAASVDCNDSDATVYTEQYYYVDKDLDGMGWGSLVPVCASTAPSGYSTNANEVKEYNDSIPNAGIEIAGDKKDNDGDGKIDEGNTVATNGYHPYYGTLDPADRASVIANLYGFGGYKYGRIWVKYLDGSTWTYRPVNVNTAKTTSVVMDSASGYLFVTNALTGAVYTVNPYTGNLK